MKTDLVSLLTEARRRVEASVLFKRFINHTPLENDIAVWMADFAQEAIEAAQREARAPIDVEQMRANLHATFNGGHHEEATRSAFHHGMDTVCNVLEAHQKGEHTNGILPAAQREARVTRIEVIDETGRVFGRWNTSVQLSYQDNGRTLKVFVGPTADPVTPDVGSTAPLPSPERDAP